MPLTDMRFNNGPAQLPEILIATSLTFPLDELIQHIKNG